MYRGAGQPIQEPSCLWALMPKTLVLGAWGFPEASCTRRVSCVEWLDVGLPHPPIASWAFFPHGPLFLGPRLLGAGPGQPGCMARPVPVCWLGGQVSTPGAPGPSGGVSVAAQGGPARGSVPSFLSGCQRPLWPCCLGHQGPCWSASEDGPCTKISSESARGPPLTPTLELGLPAGVCRAAVAQQGGSCTPLTGCTCLRVGG